jgi:3-hydroxy acid dehydrogenase/malonic semialdehyde reductase
MIIFVTGATAGFGEATTRRFVRDGHKVVAAARRADRLSHLAKSLGEDHVLPLVLDVSRRQAVIDAVQSLPEPFREIDVLVNNAGLALGLEPADRADLDDWETMVDTNIKGLLYVTHALLPGMAARQRGHIVNLGSVAANYPYPGGNVYGGTKAFVRQFSLNLRADLLGKGVRVTAIEPGMCGGTEFSTVRFGGDQQKADKVYEGIHALSADDIAETIFWVATLPSHINVNTLELMPVNQAFAPFAVKRQVAG